MVAHRSQLHRVPDSMSDDVAVLLEPFACAIHAALRANVPDGGSVFVVGAGTVGILTLLAVKLLTRADHVIVAAKHPAQRVAARLAGADVVVVPEHAAKAVRRSEHAMKLTPERGKDFLLGGVDVAIESTGSKSALDLALRTTKAGGRVVLSGIPGPGADLTPVWFRELELVGAYTSGTERVGDVDRSTFDLAIELASGLPMLADMVGARYPLDRWREAIDHAMSAGRLGTFKVAFAPQETKEETNRPMPRPGFVLEVDERTPPLFVHQGEGFRLQRFPLGTRVVYPPDSLPGLKDVNGAIRHALLNPIDAEPLSELLSPGMKLTIAIDDISLPLPPMTTPDIRQRIIEHVIELAARKGVEDVKLIVANALHRRMTADEIRRMVGERVFRSFWPDDL